MNKNPTHIESPLEVLANLPEGPQHPTPLLFIHGAWHAAWCWQEHFLPYFAQRGYAAYALSLRGHGNSPGRSQVRRMGLRAYLADLEQVAGQFAQPPVLVGHSLGGWLAQKYLERHPLPAVVLLAAMSPGGSTPFLKQAMRSHQRELLRFGLLGRFDSPDLAHAAFFAPDTPRAAIARYLTRLGTQGEASLIMPQIALDRVHLTPDQLPPALVLGAEHDAVIAPAKLDATAARLGTQAEVLPGLGHDMMLEPGWERVAGRIAGWLAAQGL